LVRLLIHVSSDSSPPCFNSLMNFACFFSLPSILPAIFRLSVYLSINDSLSTSNKRVISQYNVFVCIMYVLVKNIRHLVFIYLQFFYLYCYLLITGIVYKFKRFLKQRIIYSKCHKSIFQLKL